MAAPYAAVAVPGNPEQKCSGLIEAVPGINSGNRGPRVIRSRNAPASLKQKPPQAAVSARFQGNPEQKCSGLIEADMKGDAVSIASP